jgi:hypothetical protein
MTLCPGVPPLDVAIAVTLTIAMAIPVPIALAVSLATFAAMPGLRKERPRRKHRAIAAAMAAMTA